MNYGYAEQSSSSESNCRFVIWRISLHIWNKIFYHLITSLHLDLYESSPNSHILILLKFTLTLSFHCHLCGFQIQFLMHNLHLHVYYLATHTIVFDLITLLWAFYLKKWIVMEIITMKLSPHTSYFNNE